MFFAACTTFQSTSCKKQCRVIPEQMSLKNQRACYVFRSLYDFSEDTRANASEEPKGFNMLLPSSTF